MIPWEHDCKRCLYNTEPKAGACEECKQNMVWKAGDKFASVDKLKTLSTDWVLVVRCKDCKWYEIAHLKRDGTDDKRHTPSVCVKGTYAIRRRADWYCADGERREDGKVD